jgi:hypothetical protein
MPSIFAVNWAPHLTDEDEDEEDEERGDEDEEEGGGVMRWKEDKRNTSVNKQTQTRPVGRADVQSR